MNLPSSIRTLNIALLILMGVGLAAGQEAAPPVRTVLAQGKVRYVAPETKGIIQPSANRAKPLVTTSAKAALNLYASRFGIKDPASELREFRSTSRGSAGDIVRYRQLYKGFPVFGGELVLTLDGAGQVNSLSGEISPDLQLANLQPAVARELAQRNALAAMAKYHPEHRYSLAATDPELWVYDPGLVGPDTGAAARLVWRFEVTAPALSGVRELVLVDASDGSLALHFNQIETALRQSTYTANGSSVRPGTLLCNETQPPCTSGTNLDADQAHGYGRDTYNFYLDHHGRDSFDNLGGTLISTVNYLYSGCPNAFWDGTQMTYCAGTTADDVVGHELTHAVTERSSGLIYYYQSGAINESLSDLWGEFIDLTNGSGNDAPSARWMLGEDATSLGVIRNMANPPAYNQPDRMRSPLYSVSTSDSGGVHRNSGVNNKAVSLLVDGGSFNGYTVSGIGINKVAALYYRVQTQHLTSGSDYADLYLALNQACRNMIGGAEGIIAGDCLQVANSTAAVEMNSEPAADVGSEAAICAVNQVPSNVLYNSAESSAETSQWSVTRLTGTAGTWFYGLLGGSTAGRFGYYTPGVNGVSNYALNLLTPVVLPANAFLHFRHKFNQEQASGNWDGGIVEYSTDGGTTWSDASALYNAGKNYNGTLSTGFGNPSEGSSAFVGASHGFVSTRYDLGSLTGLPLQVRFRNTSDSTGYTGQAWAIDEVRIYTCGTDTSDNLLPTASAGADKTGSPSTQVTLDGSASVDPDGYIASTQWTQLSGTQVAITQVGASMTFTAPLTPVQEQLEFRLTITDNRGAQSSDEVAVTVINQQPVTNAGADQARKPRDTVLLQGSATDSDGAIASYSWSQTAGPAAGLTKSFVMPLSNATAQAFWLSTSPYAVGTSFLYLNFAPGTLTNLGGTATLQPPSEFSICQQITGNVCTARYRLNLAGTVTAPVAPDTTQPRTWTLQGVSISDGTPVTGSFVFNANTAVASSIQVTSGNPAGPVLSFTAPSVPGAAALTFRLAATDNAGGSGSDEVTVTVTNLAPTASAGADLSTRPRTAVQLAGIAADSDGGVASVAWSQLSGPAVTLSNATTSNASFIAPSVVSSGTVDLRMTVTDIDGAVTSDDISVAVTNVAPTANAGADRAAKPRDVVQLAGVATDPDDTVASITWSQVSGPAVVLTNAAASNPSFVAPSVMTSGTVVLRMVATDRDGALASDDVSITLTNLAPTANAGTDLAAKPRATVQLAGVGIDPDGGVVSISWSQLSGPATTLANGTTGNASFIGPSVAASGTVVLRMTVTDVDGALASDEVSITLTNIAPTANAGADKSVKAGADVTLAASGTDADGLISSYGWIQTGGPAVTLARGSSSTAGFEAPSATTASTLAFQLTVTDNDGATAIDQVTVNVDAKSAGGGGSLDGWAMLALLGLLAGQCARRRFPIRPAHRGTTATW